MTDKFFTRTVAHRHAVIAIILIRTNFGTRRAGESWFTVANSINGTARTAVLTFTWEPTIDTVCAGRTCFRAVGTSPARITVASAGDVMAISVSAVALLQTSLSV